MNACQQGHIVVTAAWPGHTGASSGRRQVKPANMRIPDLYDIRIAVISDSVQQRSYLKLALSENGIKVVVCEPPSRMLLKKLAKLEMDVLLLDIHEESDESGLLLDELIDEVKIPIIFNDVSGLTVNESRVMDKWFGKLLQKIVVLTKPTLDGESTVDRSYESLIAALPPVFIDKKADIARHVWVLGASLGGPEMVKRFLAALPQDLPVAFILAQHLGANFVALLAKQLDDVTPLHVMTAREGHVLRHGEVVVAPAFERLTINPIGAIKLEPIAEATTYSPSVDQVIMDTMDRYPKSCHAIIFSGMGDDGKKGCQYLARRGGRVWVQESSSCIISAMPDSVAKTGVSEFAAAPEALAKHLIQKVNEDALREVC
ncbi:MAG: chemotaxis protein CheB [Gammaproteobacteria bacterium]